MLPRLLQIKLPARLELLEILPVAGYAARKVLQTAENGAEIPRVLPQPLPGSFGERLGLDQVPDLLTDVVDGVLPARCIGTAGQASRGTPRITAGRASGT